jgi:hypothetical protein
LTIFDILRNRIYRSRGKLAKRMNPTTMDRRNIPSVILTLINLYSGNRSRCLDRDQLPENGWRTGSIQTNDRRRNWDWDNVLLVPLSGPTV